MWNIRGTADLVDAHLVERAVCFHGYNRTYPASKGEQFVAQEELPPVLRGAGVRHVVVVRNDAEPLGCLAHAAQPNHIRTADSLYCKEILGNEWTILTTN